MRNTLGRVCCTNHLATFPYFETPGAFTAANEASAAGPVTSRPWIRGASPHHDFFDLLESLAKELHVHSLMPEGKADVAAFCSLLAKIAVSYTVAERGITTYGSRLARIALAEEMRNCMHYIGSVVHDEPPSDVLHELSLRPHPRTGSILLRVRLLAKLGTPTYFVVLPFPDDLEK
jgi:hypothetical protein